MSDAPAPPPALVASAEGELPAEMERIYGLLWGVTTEDKRVHAARRIALSRIDRDGQRRGIEWAAQNAGPPKSGWEAER